MSALPRLRRLRRLLRGRRPTHPAAESAITLGRWSYSAAVVHTYGHPGTWVSVGNFSSIAKDVEFLPTGNHHISAVSTFPFAQRMELDLDEQPRPDKGPIHVGHDVWIGRGAKILGGVRIGNGAVVAAYSVVAQDVPPYAIVAGNPAKIRRMRFDDDTIDALSELAWWDWPDDVIRARAQELVSYDVTSFITRHRDLSDPI